MDILINLIRHAGPTDRLAVISAVHNVLWTLAKADSGCMPASGDTNRLYADALDAVHALSRHLTTAKGA